MGVQESESARNDTKLEESIKLDGFAGFADDKWKLWRRRSGPVVVLRAGSSCCCCFFHRWMGRLTGDGSAIELPTFPMEGGGYVKGWRWRCLRASGGAGLGRRWLHLGSQQGLLVARSSLEHGFFDSFKEKEREQGERCGAGVGWSIGGGSPVTVMYLLW
ncbi:hypothetical protein FXO38_34179 [Capsicum annuum]|nr:hypothetical protein FXO38_34179 [Capsicum annuum]